MKKLLTLAALLVLSSSAFALTDSPEARAQEADRYLLATPPKEMFADMAEQVAKTVPPDKREMLRAVLTKYLDVDALTKAMKDSMVKNFTADELKALADFYGSAIGKSAMKKFGTYMAELMPVIQNEMGKAMAKANAEMQPKPAAPAAPAATP